MNKNVKNNNNLYYPFPEFSLSCVCLHSYLYRRSRVAVMQKSDKSQVCTKNILDFLKVNPLHACLGSKSSGSCDALDFGPLYI